MEGKVWITDLGGLAVKREQKQEAGERKGFIFQVDTV